jgi:hypothetical protein
MWPDRSLLAAISLTLAALAGGCTKPRPTQCPGSTNQRCVGEQVCTFDEGQGCHVCQCEPLDSELDAPGPDDRGQPPPMHGPGGP